MSNDEFLRQQTQEQLRSSPHTEKATEQQVPNYLDRTVINNEIDRVRQELDRKKD